MGKKDGLISKWCCYKGLSNGGKINMDHYVTSKTEKQDNKNHRWSGEKKWSLGRNSIWSDLIIAKTIVKIIKLGKSQYIIKIK